MTDLKLLEVTGNCIPRLAVKNNKTQCYILIIEQDSIVSWKVEAFCFWTPYCGNFYFMVSKLDLVSVDEHILFSLLVGQIFAL